MSGLVLFASMNTLTIYKFYNFIYHIFVNIEDTKYTSGSEERRVGKECRL